MSPDEMDKILETVNFREKFSTLPEFKPGDSPTVVASSPKVFIQSYTRYVWIFCCIIKYYKMTFNEWL